jgi:hypothetical protein
MLKPLLYIVSLLFFSVFYQTVVYGQTIVEIDTLKTDTLSKNFLGDASYIKDLEETPVYFDSLNVYINPPKHFRKADTIFNGFIHVGANSSIMLSKAHPVLLAVAPFYDSLSFTQQNETLIFKDTLFLNNGKFGFLFVVEFEFRDVPMQRISLITGNKEETFVAVATYPKMVSQLLYPVFIESFKTIKIEE